VKLGEESPPPENTESLNPEARSRIFLNVSHILELRVNQGIETTAAIPAAESNLRFNGSMCLFGAWVSSAHLLFPGVHPTKQKRSVYQYSSPVPRVESGPSGLCCST
jgi:hypothetical protein